MSNLLRTRILFVVASLFLLGSASAHELEPFGNLPELDANWEIRVGDQSLKQEPEPAFRWVVFRNKATGDFLSFATRVKLAKDRTLESLSDNALEIFPNGRPVWTQPAGVANTNVLTIQVAEVGPFHDARKRERVLEYCFISESPGRANLMAQGRAWIGEQGALFAQHTSARPITADFIERTFKAILREQTNLAAR